MALGTITTAKEVGAAASAPTFTDLITVVGDGAYPSGGSAGLAALLRTKYGDQREIVSVLGQSQPDTLSELEYDHTNDKLFARVRTTGVESAVADQSLVTYRLAVTFR